MDKDKGAAKTPSIDMGAVIGDLAECLASASPEADTGAQLKALCMLGDAQFVCWRWIKEDFVTEILSKKGTNEINKLLIERFCKTNPTIFNEITKECLKYERMKKYKYEFMFDQCRRAYDEASYNLVVLGLCLLINCLLADLSVDNSISSILSRMKTIKDRLVDGKIEISPLDKTTIFTLLITVSHAIKPYVDSLDILVEELNYPNCYKIIIGAGLSKKTEFDCLKMLQLLYGLLVLSPFISEDMSASGSSKTNCVPPKLVPFSLKDLFIVPDEND